MKIQKITFTKREEELLTDLFKHGNLHPNYYTGRGRFIKKSADHAEYLVNTLENYGMIEGRHFRRGNDAPKNGHSGEYVKILAAGRKLKKFRQFT